jgi:hypothetical protein
MANQTITVSKSGANWTTATEANTAVEAALSAENKAWYSSAKDGGDLTSFSISLADSNTLLYTRVWTADGWASLSSRKDDAAAQKVTLESAGFTVNITQPAYV